MLCTLHVSIIGFASACLNFRSIFSQLTNDPHVQTKYTIKDGYLFRGSRLCILRTYVRDFLVWEMHGGGSIGHHGRGKTQTLDEKRFF